MTHSGQTVPKSGILSGSTHPQQHAICYNVLISNNIHQSPCAVYANTWPNLASPHSRTVVPEVIEEG